jgi:hypothetical protein
MPIVKYRLTEPKLSPRRTKLQVPGWAGEPVPRKDGEQEYSFHCVPFSEYVKGGMEALWPYGDVYVKAGPEFDFSELGEQPTDGRAWPPLRSFGAMYYSFQLLLDLKVEPGMAVKVETHPRFYTDPFEFTPVAVPALIRGWWPMIFFLIFKTPSYTHVFKRGEPFVQFTIVPEEYDFELATMDEEEAAERELQSRRIYAARETITKDSRWTSATNTVFDASYRRLAGAARK